LPVDEIPNMWYYINIGKTVSYLDKNKSNKRKVKWIIIFL